MLTRLNQTQVKQKIDFISHYMSAGNAATASKLDANANVSHKNIATLEAEINKDINIQVNRTLVTNKISSLFGEEVANEYLRQIEAHEIYVHDETSLKPYCVSANMYPLLTDGLTKLGGESKAPKHLESFCGTFINFVFAGSSQFAGAFATVEFLMYFDYFAAKDFGDDYLSTHEKKIRDHFQQIVYTINQPAAARGYQSVFWNLSLFDEPYFDSMFGTFVFPDFTKPEYARLRELQNLFMQWFNDERTRAVLTFPVVTAAMLVDSQGPVDKVFAEDRAQDLADGNSFFVYMSESADSLASCCRLRNEVSDNTFSYSLGAGGVATGSINVITVNMNRLIQDKRDLAEEITKVHKYQVAYRKLMEDYKDAGMLTIYDAGFINLDKQYLTIGINGMVEAAESLGYVAGNNDEYKEFVSSQLKIIYDKNKEAKAEYGYMFNTEFVPAENLGPKNAKWDAKDGYKVSRDCYNSYFYVVEDDNTNVVDKFVLHGKDIIRYLDGGSALHLNLEQKMTKGGYLNLFNVAAKTGTNYFCTNVAVTCCNECGYIDKRTLHECSQCGSKDVDWATRIIGYLKKVTNWSKDRQKEHHKRFYHNTH